jgi:hypothetical protein
MRCDPAQLPKLYADVINKRLKSVGKVVEVFGSVAALTQLSIAITIAGLLQGRSCSYPGRSHHHAGSREIKNSSK